MGGMVCPLWVKADICDAKSHARFTPDSDRKSRLSRLLPDFHFHDLRHEAISRLFERGLNIAEVSAISGHKELRMLQRYTHLRAIDLVDRLG